MCSQQGQGCPHSLTVGGCDWWSRMSLHPPRCSGWGRLTSVSHQKVKHWIRCCYCIPWVPSFPLICIKSLLKHFHLGGHFRSLEIVRGHKKVKHWIFCCFCIPWVPSFRLICIKPQLKHFNFGGHFRSLEVVRGHQKVEHWIWCCYCCRWFPSFRLICIKPS